MNAAALCKDALGQLVYSTSIEWVCVCGFWIVWWIRSRKLFKFVCWGLFSANWKIGVWFECFVARCVACSIYRVSANPMRCEWLVSTPNMNKILTNSQSHLGGSGRGCFDGGSAILWGDISDLSVWLQFERVCGKVFFFFSSFRELTIAGSRWIVWWVRIKMDVVRNLFTVDIPLFKGPRVCVCVCDWWNRINRGFFSSCGDNSNNKFWRGLITWTNIYIVAIKPEYGMECFFSLK